MNDEGGACRGCLTSDTMGENPSAAVCHLSSVICHLSSVICHLSEPGSVGAIVFRCKAPVRVLQLHPPTSLSLLRKTTTVFQYAGLVPGANLWDFLAYSRILNSTNTPEACPLPSRAASNGRASEIHSIGWYHTRILHRGVERGRCDIDVDEGWKYVLWRATPYGCCTGPAPSTPSRGSMVPGPSLGSVGAAAAARRRQRRHRRRLRGPTGAG